MVKFGKNAYFLLLLILFLFFAATQYILPTNGDWGNKFQNGMMIVVVFVNKVNVVNSDIRRSYIIHVFNRYNNFDIFIKFNRQKINKNLLKLNTHTHNH